jgi:hypothetical protein
VRRAALANVLGLEREHVLEYLVVHEREVEIQFSESE